MAKNKTTKGFKLQFMVTYLCKNCQMDFAITEPDDPKCFYCESKDNFLIIKKQKLTPKVMADRLKLVIERMMKNLKEAYKSEMSSRRILARMNCWMLWQSE